MNGQRVNLTSLKRQFADGGYQVQETAHFLLFRRAEAPATVLVHWFAPEEFNSNISHYLVQELKPSGIITSNQRLGELMKGIIVGKSKSGCLPHLHIIASRGDPFPVR